MYIRFVSGYCPQFDALFGELTGRETLHMFAMMKGLRLRSAAPTAETLAHALGFLKHLDKRVNYIFKNILNCNL